MYCWYSEKHKVNIIVWPQVYFPTVFSKLVISPLTLRSFISTMDPVNTCPLKILGVLYKQMHAKIHGMI